MAVNKKAIKKKAVKKQVVPKRKKAKDGTDRGNNKAVLNKKMLGIIADAATIGCTYKEMALAVGLDADTLRRIRKEQKGVQEMIDTAKSLGCRKAKNKVYQLGVNTPLARYKEVHFKALQYFLNNNTEYSSQLEVHEGTAIPKDVDVSDEEAVTTYLEMIKKP